MIEAHMGEFPARYPTLGPNLLIERWLREDHGRRHGWRLQLGEAWTTISSPPKPAGWPASPSLTMLTQPLLWCSMVFFMASTWFVFAAY